MATVATNFRPNKQVQHRIINYYQSCAQLMRTRYNLRDQMLSIDRSYMREVDNTIEQYKAKQANKRGDPTKFQNIVVPVVMPQVEAAVTYQTSVFLQGYPMFGVVADASNAEAAQQMDTIIGEQQIRGGWVAEYQKAFRNGFKYNLIATEVDWKQEVTFAVESSQTTSDAELKEVIWAGNSIKTLDLYNTIFDPRVPPEEIATRGEFAGYSTLYGRVGLVQYLNSLPDHFNKQEALTSTSNGFLGATENPWNYYFPELNPDALISPDYLSGTDWMAWVGLGTSKEANLKRFFSGMYQVAVFYARLIPADFGITNVPGINVPQVWKIIIVNNCTIVSMERLTNAHGFLPILFAQPYNDGLGYQTKSLAVNVGPIQEITTAFANSSIAARRRAVSDRMLYDPSRVSAAAINNDNPTSKIPVKPSAFGDQLGAAVFPIPFRDDLFQINGQEMQTYMGLSNIITGMNPARQGQFVKGNKTRTEFVEIMQNSNGRDQTVAMSMEASLFTPTKEIIKANILQFQGGVQLYNRETTQPVQVDPATLRKAMMTFKVSDGLTPSEKLIDGESLTVAFQTIQSVPQLANGFNLPAMFSYLMKSRGARLRPFEKSPEQLAYEQAVGQWQQAVMGLAQVISTIKDISQEQIQEMMTQLPPQPTPEQFGWNPQEGTQPANTQSILEQVAQAGQGQTPGTQAAQQA